MPKILKTNMATIHGNHHFNDENACKELYESMKKTSDEKKYL